MEIDNFFFTKRMHMIELYTTATPNVYKISTALEEVQLEYRVHEINLAANQQKSTHFSD